MAGGQPRQTAWETSSQPTGGHSGMHLSSQATQEAEIRRFVVPGQSGQNITHETILIKTCGCGGICMSPREGS
jgi:hypothetical protein